MSATSLAHADDEIDVSSLKTCSDCTRSLPRSMFSKRADAPDGLQSKCVECSKRYSAHRYASRHRRKKSTRAELAHIVEQLRELPVLDIAGVDTYDAHAVYEILAHARL